MRTPFRKLAEVRLWVFLLLTGFLLAGTACGGDEECHPDSSNYPECLEEGPTG